MARRNFEAVFAAEVFGADRKGKASPILYGLGIALAFVQPWLGLVPFVAVALLWLVPDPRIERYLQRQREEIERQHRHEHTAIPTDFDYDKVRGLSAEVLAKLKRTLPSTLGQAARISGVTPAAVSLLLVHLQRRAA